MGSIIIPTFGGEVPRTTARLLGDTQAAKAVNCQLQRGALEPLLGPLQIASLPSSASTIFKHPTDGWLSWSKSVDVVKSAVLDIAGETPLGAPPLRRILQADLGRPGPAAVCHADCGGREGSEAAGAVA